MEGVAQAETASHRVLPSEQLHQREQVPDSRAPVFIPGSTGKEVHLLQIKAMLIGKFLNPLQQENHFIGRSHLPEFYAFDGADEVFLPKVVVDFLNDAGYFRRIAGNFVHLVGDAHQQV